ncbi:MAG: hypothetical protein GC146_03730 [Limimaricola sp.]|nr:hypothetical protein [Limimaricola sp.]
MIGAAALGLAACAPQVPDSGAGFREYGQFQPAPPAPVSSAPAAATGAPLAAPMSAAATTPPAPQGGMQPAIPSSDLAAAGIGAASPAADPATGRTAGVDATPGNAAPPLMNNPGLSDEQSFQAVASRETIQSDAERRAAQAAAYQVVQPGAVPDRPQDAGPNIVAYALGAPNVKGQAWYSRFIFASKAREARNCAKYVSDDAAQRAFLSRGGPDRDPMGLDPDGDGFACNWDPAPFKQAAGN